MKECCRTNESDRPGGRKGIPKFVLALLLVLIALAIAAFLNSCAPNARQVGATIGALRPAWERLMFECALGRTERSRTSSRPVASGPE